MITVIGSIGYDLTAVCERLPNPGETLVGTGFVSAPGGKGANQALAAKRAGSDTQLIGAIGNDAFAPQALELLDRGGVDLSGVKTSQTTTGIALIFVGGTGENMIVIAQGANATLMPEDIAPSVINRGDYILLQLEIPTQTVAAAIKLAKEKGAISILNTAPFHLDAVELMANADITVANETEFDLAAEAMGLHGADRKAKMTAFVAATGKAIIVTLGADGVLAATPAGNFAASALKIIPVDTVGAGDTFCGYLGASLAQGLSLDAAMARAAAAGSLACTMAGAQPSIPMSGDVLKAMA